MPKVGEFNEKFVKSGRIRNPKDLMKTSVEEYEIMDYCEEDCFLFVNSK